MRLSLYVIETTNKDQPILFNTVTRQQLPRDASEEVLAANHFLEGSEEAAIKSHLTRPHQKASFTIINTWECNLRCTHCTVSHKLLKHDPIKLDPKATMDFFKRFQDFYNIPNIMMTFLGGEPLLDSQSILDCMELGENRGFLYDVTTNLTPTFDDKVWEVLRRLDHIGVSLDGLEAAHNEQRRPLTLTTDPFWTTINNLKLLIKDGHAKKISVQAAMADKHLSDENRRDFYRLLLKLGIEFDKISYACLHPTVKHPQVTPRFIDALKMTTLRGQVCCKYRYYNFVIDRDGTIFADYYTWEKVGSIHDPIEKLDEAAKALMMRMPALQDPTCRKCPALGYCWGGCTNGEIVVGNSPSKYCDQDGLIKAMKSRALTGSLL